jgi:hypothetical protein
MLKIFFLAALGDVNLGHDHFVGSNSNRPTARSNNTFEYIIPRPCIQNIPGSYLDLKTGYSA